MMTAEERVASLHARMRKRRQVQETRKTAFMGAGCLAMACGLLTLIIGSSGQSYRQEGGYSGATMLFEGAGPFVLTAVIAFMAGVVISVILIRRQEKIKRESENAENPDAKQLSFLEDDSVFAVAGGKKEDYKRDQ